jgi:hypothetical protein
VVEVVEDLLRRGEAVETLQFAGLKTRSQSKGGLDAGSLGQPHPLDGGELGDVGIAQFAQVAAEADQVAPKVDGALACGRVPTPYNQGQEFGVGQASGPLIEQLLPRTFILGPFLDSAAHDRLRACL